MYNVAVELPSTTIKLSYSISDLNSEERETLNKLHSNLLLVEPSCNAHNSKLAFRKIIRIVKNAMGLKGSQDHSATLRAHILLVGLQRLIVIYSKCSECTNLCYATINDFLERYHYVNMMLSLKGDVDLDFSCFGANEQDKLWKFANCLRILFDDEIIQARNNKGVLVFALGMALGELIFLVVDALLLFAFCLRVLFAATM